MSSFTYNSSVPLSTSVISQTQQPILTNFQSIGSWVAIDHYGFGTGSDGWHTHVTNPNQNSHPATTANPIIYGMQDSANVGVIQYSRGPSNAVPTPLTALQSPAAGSTLAAGPATTSVFNFSGLSRSFTIAMAMTKITGTPINVSAFIFWDGTTLVVLNNNSGVMQFQSSGSSLVLSNGSTSAGDTNTLFWTLKFNRLQ